MNILVVLISSVVLTIVVYVVHNKILKKDLEKFQVIKLGVLGLLVGGLNYLILNNSETEFSKLLGDFDTGNPKF